MQSHPLRAPLALARRPSALDNQPIPGRLYTVGDYLAHEHADVIRQLTANNWRTPLPLPSHSRGRFTRKPAPWPTRANRPQPTSMDSRRGLPAITVSKAPMGHPDPYA